MAEIEPIGLALDTSGIDKGIKALNELSKQGPIVEKSMSGISGEAKRVAKNLAELGADAGDGLKKTGEAAKQAAAGLKASGTAAREAVTDTASLARAVASLTSEEEKHIRKLLEEANGLRMTRGEMEAYRAAQRGMSSAAQEVARATGNRIEALKAEQRAISGTNDSMFALARGGVQAFIGSALVNYTLQAATALYEASAAAQRLQTTLNYATGGNGAKELEYVRASANKLGLEFASTAKAYAQFQAASRGTAMEGDKARAVFEAVAKASAVFGLSADETGGVLRALQQMMSKGTVQAEELRGQLGERLPGAFQSAAKAMGVTTAELGKMLEQGQVISDDFLPKFAAQLEKDMGGAAEKAADRLDASVNRMKNAWEQLKQTAGDSGLNRGSQAFLNMATSDMNAFTDAILRAKSEGASTFGQLASGIGTISGRALSLNLVSDAFRSNAEQADAFAKKLVEADKELATLEAQGAKKSSNLMLRQMYTDAVRVRDALREAKVAKDILASNAAGSSTPGADDANFAAGAGNWKLDQDKQAEAEKYMQGLRMKSAGINKDYMETLSKLSQLHKEGRIGEGEYAAEVSELAQRTWDASTAGKENAKAKREGVSASKAAAAAVKKEQTEYDKLISSIKLKIAEAEEEVKFGRKLSDADKLRFAISEEGTKKMSAARKAEAEVELKRLDALEKIIATTKREVAAYNERVAAQEASNRAYVAQYDAVNRARQAVNDLVAASEQDADRLKLEVKLIGASAAQRKSSIALYDLEIEKKKELRKLDETDFASDSDRQEQRALVEAAYARKAANLAGQAYVEEWNAAIQQVEDIFVTGFADMLNNGKGGWESFCKSLKTSFLTMVVKQIYTAFVKPIVVNLVGNLMGMTGGGGWLSALGGLVGMGGGGSGGGNSALGVASNASTLYGLGSGSTLGTAGNYLTSAGTYFGSNTMTGLGMSMQGYTLPANMVGPGAGVGVNSGGGAMGGMGWGAAALAIPFIAAYLGGMFKDEKMVGSGLTGELGGDMYGYQLMRESGGLFDGPDYRYLIAEKEIADTKAKIEALKKDPAYDGKGEAARESKLQALYNKLENLELNYGDSIAGSQGPIKILQDAFKAMREGTAAQADSLGLDGDSIRAMKVALGLEDIHADTGGKGLELTGLTQEEAGAKIQAALAQANEELARSVLGSWEEQTREISRMVWDQVLVDNGGDTEQYARVGTMVTDTITEQVWVMSEYVREGETAVQALGRLSTSLLTANHVFDLLGGTLFDTSLAGADMASDLMDLFGGAEKFVASTSNYYDKFYSDQDKVDTQTRLLNAELKKLGIETMPASREALTDYIDGLDLSTEEGQKLFASLMGLVDVFDMIYTSAENIASLKGDLGMQLLRAQGNDAEATRLEREKQIKELEKYKDPELVKLQKDVWAAEDKNKADADAKQALETAKSAGLANLQAAIGREKEYWASFTTDAKDALTKASSYFDLVTGAAKSLRGSIDDTSSWSAAAGMVYIEQALANARMGLGLSDFDKTRDSIGAATGGLVMDNYATQAELNYDKKMLAGQLDELGGFAEMAKSDAQKQLDIGNAQIKRLDDTLKFWQDYGKDQVDATMSVTDAVNALFKLLDPKEQERIKAEAAAKAGLVGGGATGTSPIFSGGGVLGGSVAGSSRVTVIGLTADGRAMYSDGSIGQSAAGQYSYNSDGLMTSNGYSAAEFERFKASGEWELDPATGNRKKRASFAIGTNFVPRDMTAQIHQGERIIPAADNRALMAALNNQGGGNAELVAEVRALRAELQDIKGNTAATAEYSRRTSSDLNQVTEGGNAMRTAVMT